MFETLQWLPITLGIKANLLNSGHRTLIDLFLPTSPSISHALFLGPSVPATLLFLGPTEFILAGELCHPWLSCHSLSSNSQLFLVITILVCHFLWEVFWLPNLKSVIFLSPPQFILYLELWHFFLAFLFSCLCLLEWKLHKACLIYCSGSGSQSSACNNVVT